MNNAKIEGHIVKLYIFIILIAIISFLNIHIEPYEKIKTRTFDLSVERVIYVGNGIKNIYCDNTFDFVVSSWEESNASITYYWQSNEANYNSYFMVFDGYGKCTIDYKVDSVKFVVFGE